VADKLIRRHYSQDDNEYALFFRPSDGKVWDVANNTWATFTDANIDNYDVPGTELGTYSRIYTFAIPTHANFGTGRFTAILFDRVGGTPAVGDILTNTDISGPSGEAQIDFHYDGATIVPFVTYYARIDVNVDTGNSQDEWTVRWYRNGVLVDKDSGNVTLQLIKRADGTDLQASTAMSQVGSVSVYKKDLLTTARMTAGEAVIAVTTATIDGVSRTWSELKSRDV